MQRKDQIRKICFISFNNAFNQLIDVINSMEGMHPIFKSHCMMNLDQGAFWARHAISNLPIADEEVQTPVEQQQVEQKAVEKTEDLVENNVTEGQPTL